jgi:photosystem II stability/assembly factor-like uncharacterized protein
MVELSEARAARSNPPLGGKVLLRLLQYLGKRDDAMNDEVVLAAARPNLPDLHLTAQAMTALRPEVAGPAAAEEQRPSQRYARALIDAAATDEQPAGPAAAAPQAAPGGPPPAQPVWKALGPSLIPNGQTYGSNRIDVIGRVACVAVDPGNPSHILCGSAGGGIWETSDTGATWAPRTDRMPTLAIGALVFDPHDRRTVYAGSGEGNFYYALGAGVYRSTDGGTTWSVLASSPFVGVGFFSLVVNQSAPNLLYAGTTSGFFTSANAGVSWAQRRSRRCWGISVAPTGGAHAEILATFDDGLHVSTNGGSAFAAVPLPGAPTGQWARLAVDRVHSAPDIAYVFGAMNGRAYLWRRTGTSWTAISLPSPAINVTQAWYDWYVAAPPTERDRVYLGAIDGYRGDLSGGGWHWTDITTQGSHSIHPDQHCLTFGADGVLYAGSDGGLFRSADHGASWKALNRGLGITEVEYLGSDPATANWLLAGTQDNGTIRYTGNTVWDHVADGDGGDCGVNPLNANEVYHSYYDVSLERSNNKGNTWTNLNPPSMTSLFYPPVTVYGSTVTIGGSALEVTRTGAPPWTTVPLGLAAQDVATASCAPDANTVFVGPSSGGCFASIGRALGA